MTVTQVWSLLTTGNRKDWRGFFFFFLLLARFNISLIGKKKTATLKTEEEEKQRGSARQENRDPEEEVQREGAFERKKNGEKNAAERETNSLQSLRDTGKNWQVVIAIIITSTFLMVAVITCFSSPAPLTAATFRNITRAA